MKNDLIKLNFPNADFGSLAPSIFEVVMWAVTLKTFLYLISWDLLWIVQPWTCGGEWVAISSFDPVYSATCILHGLHFLGFQLKGTTWERLSLEVKWPGNQVCMHLITRPLLLSIIYYKLIVLDVFCQILQYAPDEQKWRKLVEVVDICRSWILHRCIWNGNGDVL